MGYTVSYRPSPRLHTPQTERPFMDSTTSSHAIYTINVPVRDSSRVSSFLHHGARLCVSLSGGEKSKGGRERDVDNTLSFVGKGYCFGTECCSL